MCWNRDDEMLLLVLVPAPEALWIILCDHGNVLRHLFWVFFRLCIVSGLKSKLWVPLLVAPLSFKLSRCRYLDLGFV